MREKIPIIITRGCFIVGLISIFICGILRLIGKIPFIAEILLNLGITLTTGALLGMTWEVAIGKKSILQLLEFLCPLVRDLQKMGIERFYEERRHVFQWEKWEKFIKNATQIDIMGNNLRQNWCTEDFLRLLREKLREHKCKFRFLLFDPDSSVATQRQHDENEDQAFKGLIRGTLNRYKEIYEEVGEELKKKELDINKFFSIKLVNSSNIYCYIVRIDDKMIVANYYRHVKGGGAPAMEIYGSNSFLFKFFSDEFEKMWEISRNYNWELHQ